MQQECLRHRPSQAANIIFMITSMIGRPEANEAAPYYFGYINRVTGDDILRTLQSQMDETLPFLRGITEEKSLFRYAPEKWSIRQMWGHVNDTERVFLMRALWFARKFDTPLPSFDQDIAVAGSQFRRLYRGRGMWRNSVKFASRPFRSSAIFLKKRGRERAWPAGIRLR